MSDVVAALKTKTVGDYIASYKKLLADRKSVPKDRAIRIAMLSSFTTTGLKETLGVKCYELGIEMECFEAPYNQVVQTIMESAGTFYQFCPDLTIVFVDVMDLLGEDFFSPYGLSEDQRLKFADAKADEVTGWVEKILAGRKGKVLLHNFRIPYYSPFGILENKQKFGFFKMVRRINDLLEERFRESSEVFVFDYDAFCSRHGKLHVTDYKMYYLGDFKLSFTSMPLLCDEYLAYIKPLLSRTRKCLVLDLDNTLWGGVVGEDGIEGIKIGPTPEGRPFLEFQKYILNLLDRGVLLAINSSNNTEEVERVFNEHPNMVLRKEHFAAIEINWNDKVTNLRSIAKKLNIGLDSLVFLDDLASNREIVRNALPSVLVPEMPEDPSEYIALLSRMTDFNTLQLTVEDRNRNRLYAAERLRQENLDSVTDIDTYLRGLKIVVTLATAKPITVPRISQLTQKTNQFNMTTRRYLEEDINRFASDPHFWVLSVGVEDRFGDSGVTGVLVIERLSEEWRIDTFLLSCRVMGRKIENAVLSFVIVRARQAGVRFLRGEFRSTPKNLPARDFYKKNGFVFKSEVNGEEVLEYDVFTKYEAPAFIEVIWKD